MTVNLEIIGLHEQVTELERQLEDERAETALSEAACRGLERRCEKLQEELAARAR